TDCLRKVEPTGSSSHRRAPFPQRTCASESGLSRTNARAAAFSWTEAEFPCGSGTKRRVAPVRPGTARAIAIPDIKATRRRIMPATSRKRRAALRTPSRVNRKAKDAIALLKEDHKNVRQLLKRL